MRAFFLNITLYPLNHLAFKLLLVFLFTSSIAFSQEKKEN